MEEINIQYVCASSHPRWMLHLILPR